MASLLTNIQLHQEEEMPMAVIHCIRSYSPFHVSFYDSCCIFLFGNESQFLHNLFLCISGGGTGEPRNSNTAKSGAPQKILPIETPAMSLDELNRLTSNFGSKALIGEGSYGRVFYAKLSSGEGAAIKKLDTSSSQEPDSDFAAQVTFSPHWFFSRNIQMIFHQGVKALGI